MKVAILGASGETGSSIVNGLLESTTTKFEITALTRPASLEKPKNLELKKRGVKLVSADPDGPEEELVKILEGIEVVISTVSPLSFSAQIPLANAAKAAGVKRFIPCTFATASPPRGVMKLREMKEDIICHIKKIYLPYTIIDVGWWYQISIPSLPSGRTQYAITMPISTIAGDGSAPSALTDIRDIGRYVARIIADPRTLNKMVFAYGEVHSQNEVFDLLEKVSGETIPRSYISETSILAGAEVAKTSTDAHAITRVWVMEYMYSWGIRGDNTPEYAQYLGYLNGKELYPDLKANTLEAFFHEVLEGNGKAVYR